MYFKIIRNNMLPRSPCLVKSAASQVLIPYTAAIFQTMMVSASFVESPSAERDFYCLNLIKEETKFTVNS